MKWLTGGVLDESNGPCFSLLVVDRAIDVPRRRPGVTSDRCPRIGQQAERLTGSSGFAIQPLIRQQNGSVEDFGAVGDVGG
jgi:hypothetical protein